MLAFALFACGGDGRVLLHEETIPIEAGAATGHWDHSVDRQIVMQAECCMSDEDADFCESATWQRRNGYDIQCPAGWTHDLIVVRWMSAD